MLRYACPCKENIPLALVKMFVLCAFYLSVKILRSPE